jgi:hypothetical protein
MEKPCPGHDGDTTQIELRSAPANDHQPTHADRVKSRDVVYEVVV